MSNNSLLLVDPNFKTDASANCHLLLKITNDSFSYAVIGKDTEEINIIFDKQGCEDVQKELKSAFETDSYLSLNYATIKAAIHTSNFIFIPDEWFDGENLSVYAKYLGSDAKVYTKHNDKLGFNTVFCLDEDLKANLPEKTDLFPQSEPLMVLFNHLADESLLIDFTAVSFNVLYIKDKKIVFQNHYQSENAEEFNYFLLLMIEQLGLTDAIPVYLQGIINEDDEHYNCLLKYFNQLYFFLPAGKQNSELLADMPKHYFSGLLALDLCE
ncbi:hypothetical protein ASU31_16465 [Pedobacter ginsenosidimutans]|uniref:DUF3822 domain-containing protein n=1 Tax=Pedobacter ginsenosidimutans TaxID=687842 RepID=A0A0T5VM22_9SPHI|nr:DUF3822 family protein [Pedobacter ginsenosidimutans]KRT14912.1 hypothetical protein ASU31_16465 [Pedobacter ginsenosidimutans]